MTALFNQNNVALGFGFLGLANLTLYPAAQGSDYHTIFNDITTGTNNFYHAGAGFDNVTGLGTPAAKYLASYYLPGFPGFGSSHGVTGAPQR